MGGGGVVGGAQAREEGRASFRQRCSIPRLGTKRQTVLGAGVSRVTLRARHMGQGFARHRPVCDVGVWVGPRGPGSKQPTSAVELRRGVGITGEVMLHMCEEWHGRCTRAHTLITIFYTTRPNTPPATPSQKGSTNGRLHYLRAIHVYGPLFGRRNRPH